MKDCKKKQVEDPIEEVVKDVKKPKKEEKPESICDKCNYTKGHTVCKSCVEKE